MSAKLRTENVQQPGGSISIDIRFRMIKLIKQELIVVTSFSSYIQNRLLEEV